MTNEININSFQEVNKPLLENYQAIQPETGITRKEADDYLLSECGYKVDSADVDAGSAEQQMELIGNKSKNVVEKNIQVDGNGREFRKDDQLIPDNHFTSNGYEYTTDSKGRVSSAEGVLRMKDPEYKREMEDVRNKEDQNYKPTDDRGHVIAHRFGGSDKLENLVPMDSKLNQCAFASLENKLADAVQAGAKVEYKVDIKYSDSTNRPSEFRVSYSIDGEKSVSVFKNGSGV